MIERVEAVAATLNATPAPDGLIFQRGEVLAGTYEIGGLLGEGGMAQVYEAHDHLLNRNVAIKAASAAAKSEQTSLRLEAQALATFLLRK